MKKKVIVISAVVALIALIAGGSLAWFSDTDSAKNTFTFGEIDIVQYEQEHDENGELQDFTQNQVLFPIVNTNDAGELDLSDEINADDANYIEKLVSVESVGKNEAYVRTFIAVPASIKDILVLDVNTADGWVADNKTWPNATVDGMEYAIVSFTYGEALAQDDVTPYNLKGVYLKETVDAQVDPADDVKKFCTLNDDGSYTFYEYDITGTVNVLVATQGIQVRGFESMTVSDAIDTVFPEAPDFTAVQ